MTAKIVFFFSSIIFVGLFILSAHDVALGQENQRWQEWFVTSFTVGWLVFWALWFRRQSR